jgi:hypothetical protein
MTDTTITNLPDAGTLTGSEFFPLDQGSTTNRVLLSVLAAFLGGGAVPTNVYIVAPSGAPYATVGAAITAINAGTAPTLINPALIIVYPGTYTTSAPIVVPQYVNVVGLINKTWASARFINDTTDVFQPSGFNTFQGLTCRQGAVRGTYFINGGNNTDISVYDCAMFGLGAGQNQGFYRASGSGWARITLQQNIVNSFQAGTTLTPGSVPVGATVDAVVLLENTTTSVRFCDTWLQGNFFDMYNVGSGANNFAFAILGIGVQDVRIESGNILRGGGGFIACYLAKGSISSGTPQIEFRNNYTGGNKIGVSPETGCTINVLNSDTAGSTGAGSIVSHNSYTGASYNPLPI